MKLLATTYTLVISAVFTCYHFFCNEILSANWVVISEYQVVSYLIRHVLRKGAQEKAIRISCIHAHTYPCKWLYL